MPKGREPGSSSRRVKPRLSRDRVLEAAMALVDTHGVESLTMRRVAGELGVEAMSLYHHVASKDDLLNALLARVVEQMDLPVAGVSWKVALRTAAHSAHDVLLAHPWAAALLVFSPGLNIPRLRQMDAILGLLRGAGLSADLTDYAYHALESHITGFTLWEVGIAAALSRVGPIDAFVESIDLADFPHVAEHARHHLNGPDLLTRGAFEFGLGLILDGIERMHHEA